MQAGTPSNVLAAEEVATTLLAAFWGAGTRMPLAAGAHRGTAGQELAIEILLITLSVAIVAACVLVLWGLRRTRTV